MEDAPGGIRVVIPAERNWKLWWGAAWLAVLLYTGNDFVFGPTKEFRNSGGVFAYWFFFISVVMIAGEIRHWLWVLGGKEIVEITPPLFTIRHDYFGLGITRNYQLKDVHDLQYVHAEQKGRRSVPEGIGFNYRGKLRRFARGVPEAEVNQLLAEIETRARTMGFGAQTAATL